MVDVGPERDLSSVSTGGGAVRLRICRFRNTSSRGSNGLATYSSARSAGPRSGFRFVARRQMMIGSDEEVRMNRARSKRFRGHHDVEDQKIEAGRQFGAGGSMALRAVDDAIALAGRKRDSSRGFGVVVDQQQMRRVVGRLRRRA